MDKVFPLASVHISILHNFCLFMTSEEQQLPPTAHISVPVRRTIDNETMGFTDFMNDMGLQSKRCEISVTLL